MQSILKTFILIAALSLLAKPSLAQWDWEDTPPAIYLDFRAEVGIMTAENNATDLFAMTRPTSFGFHLEAGHYFDRFGIFSGIGFNVLPFRQRQSRSLGSLPSENATATMTYYSIQVPLGIGYKINRAFSVHAALALHLMNLGRSVHEFSDQAPPELTLSVQERDELPTWQARPELHLGIDYDIGSRLRFMLFGAFSLSDVDGFSYDYTISQELEDDQQFAVDSSFSWWRFGMGLTYHIIR